jgi:hypothetical protein
VFLFVMKSIRYMYGPTSSVATLGENLSQALARLELPVPSLLLVLGWGRAQQRGAGRAGRPTLGEPSSAALAEAPVLALIILVSTTSCRKGQSS